MPFRSDDSLELESDLFGRTCRHSQEIRLREFDGKKVLIKKLHLLQIIPCLLSSCHKSDKTQSPFTISFIFLYILCYVCNSQSRYLTIDLISFLVRPIRSRRKIAIARTLSCRISTWPIPSPSRSARDAPASSRPGGETISCDCDETISGSRPGYEIIVSIVWSFSWNRHSLAET